MADTNLVERDGKVIWHPYTQMKTSNPPLPIVSGKGAALYTEDGDSYIDAVSSWWVNIHGHSHPYIAQKVSEQLLELEHVIFAGFTHPRAVELAERLLAILPSNQSRAFYSDNGSTAVEVALKMCFQYWSNQGKPRTKVLAFKNSYHGDTFGAMAVSARSAFTEPFDRFLFEVEFIETPNAANIDQIIQQVEELSADVAAFIYEPLIQGAGGMQMYEALYLDKLLAACKSADILSIADEVMTGFGRTGKMFASEYLEQMPDIMCFSKGITGGTMALGLTTSTSRIFDAFLSDDKSKTLFHGHSFTANPVACSAALASLDLFEKERTLLQIARIAEKHKAFASSIAGHSSLRDIRQLGTILAIEWLTPADTSYFNNLRDNLYEFFLERNIILRPLGNIVYILPPYCISDEELDRIYSAISEALSIF